MKKDRLIIEVTKNAEAKNLLLEILENNDDLMLEVLEAILDISEQDTDFREKVLDKIFETNYLARRVDKEMEAEHQNHGCCHVLVDR